MARKSDGEKIDELEKVMATFAERLDNIRHELREAGTNVNDAVKALGHLKTDYALLRNDFERLQEWKDDVNKEKSENARRMWAFGPNIVGAIVSVLLSATVSGLIAYLATRHP